MIQILRLARILLHAEGALHVAELCARAGCTSASVYRYLRTLRAAGWPVIRHELHEGRVAYSLGWSPRAATRHPKAGAIASPREHAVRRAMP